MQRYRTIPSCFSCSAMLGKAWARKPASTRRTLTNSDKQQNRRDRARKTREQRLAEQLATEQGRAAYARNLVSAEKKPIAACSRLDPTFAAAYRGLGEVYEQQKRDREAAEAYLTYVKSAPERAGSADRREPAPSHDRQTQGEQQWNKIGIVDIDGRRAGVRNAGARGEDGSRRSS